jgi:hypothetical protein
MIRLTHCSIEWTDHGCVTRFPDGAEVGAYPHPEQPHYHVIAHRCGYGDDLLAYCREHEFCHALVAERFYDDVSFVLFPLAHKLKPPGGFALLEEIAAQTLQRWLRANERPILAGCDWDALKRDALELLAGAEA